MHILHVIPSLAPETGGPVQALMKMCNALTKAGNEIVLFTSNWPKSDMDADSPTKEEAVNGLKILTFPSKSTWFTSKLPRSRTLVKAVSNSSQFFDSIIIHSLWNPLATFVMRELRQKKIRYCLMPHGMLDPVVLKHNRWKKLPWAYGWERKNIEEASLIIFNSEAEKEKAHQTGWSFRMTFVFPHIIDLTEWRELPPESIFEDKFPQVKGREVILFVGRINWVKNLDKLLEALKIVCQLRPSAMVVCIGPDSNRTRSRLENYAKVLGIEESLLFLGMMDRDGLKTAYARANVLALVSKKENFGLVAAEALASGVPVVLSEGVDLGKNLASGGPVRCVPPISEEIAGALTEMLERSVSLGHPDLEARELAERLWGDSSNTLKQLIDTLKAAIARTV